MKTKVVLWGANEKEEKVLLGIELIEDENKVQIYIFPESEAKENFYNLLLNDWRINNPVVFPENHQVIERPLSVTEGILPDNLKVERTDVIMRAKTEWHFVVLSAKLRQIYHSEIEEFKEKIGALSSYDRNLWEELKTFWQKVQEQVYEKNLFREHAKDLHNETNFLFDRLKELRKKYDQVFQKESKERAKVFTEKLQNIEKKIADGMGLQPLWNELKQIQSNFRGTNLSKSDRKEIWSRIDKTFKTIKEKKYGSADGGKRKSPLERIENRYNGLISAIKKMENSIKRDRKDLNFQGNRIEETYGQLEQEIRKAKLQMVQERINSKEKKLAEMNATRVMLEEKIKGEKEKLQRQQEKAEIKKKEQEVKARIKKEMEDKEELMKEKMEPIKEEISEITKKVASKPVKEEVSETAEKGTSKPVKEEVSETAEKETSKPDKEEVSEITEKETSEPDKEEISEASEKEISKSDAKEVSEITDKEDSEPVKEEE